MKSINKRKSDVYVLCSVDVCILFVRFGWAGAWLVLSVSSRELKFQRILATMITVISLVRSFHFVAVFLVVRTICSPSYTPSKWCNTMIFVSLISHFDSIKLLEYNFSGNNLYALRCGQGYIWRDLHICNLAFGMKTAAALVKMMILISYILEQQFDQEFMTNIRIDSTWNGALAKKYT